jgi:hypothetical protein
MILTTVLSAKSDLAAQPEQNLKKNVDIALHRKGLDAISTKILHIPS